MPAIPPVVLKKLYSKGSLRPEGDGFALDFKNTIAPGNILAIQKLELDGASLELDQVTVIQSEGQPRPAEDVSTSTPLQFPLNATFTLQIAGTSLEPGDHRLSLHVVVQDVGPLAIPVVDKSE